MYWSQGLGYAWLWLPDMLWHYFLRQMKHLKDFDPKKRNLLQSLLLPTAPVPAHSPSYLHDHDVVLRSVPMPRQQPVQVSPGTEGLASSWRIELEGTVSNTGRLIAS